MTADMDRSEFLRELEGKIRAKRVLITGGLGMIGSNIAHLLIKNGAQVTIMDACLEPYGANYFNLEGIRDEVEVTIGDIRDPEALKPQILGKDLIFNLAGQVSHNDSFRNPVLDAEINYIGHLNVLENVRQFNPGARVIHAGSRLQFGPISRIPVAEDHRLNPKTPYAFNKTVAEFMYRYYDEIHGIKTIMFRIANPYGKRCQMKHSKYAMVNYFIRRSMEGLPLTVFGDGRQLRDYIYVADLAEAMVAGALCDSTEGLIFNVGSGVGTAFGDMARLVIDVVGKGRVEYVPWPDDYLNVETGDYVTDISRIRSMTGWKPSVMLEEGVKRTVRFYEEYGTHYFSEPIG